MKTKLIIFNNSGIIDEIISEQDIQATRLYAEISIENSPLVIFEVGTEEIASMRIGEGCGYILKPILERDDVEHTDICEPISHRTVEDSNGKE